VRVVSKRDLGILVLVVIGVLVLLPVISGMGMGGWGMGPGMMGPSYGGRWGGGWGWGMGHMFGGLFWVLILVGAVLLISSLMRSHEPGAPSTGAQPPSTETPEAPLDILKRRLAKGEIGLEEYERLKRELS
jgi:uncharacterized membrane protein